MKDGFVIKNSSQNGISEDDLNLINSFTKRNFSADEIYVFSVVLCDNDVDRDNEKFTVDALKKLSKLYIGKTGILDHDVKSTNQTARIFSCKVEKIDKLNKVGEPYYRLVAKAYMPKSKKNEDVILGIDSGILKEVSVGCAVNSMKCSICGKEIRRSDCEHIKGKKYKKSGKFELCYAILDEPFDAYEWSFVAVPAQREAGVIKKFNSRFIEDISDLDSFLNDLHTSKSVTFDEVQSENLFKLISNLYEKAKLGDIYQNELKNEVIRLSSIVQPDVSLDIMKNIVDKMSIEELTCFKKSFKTKMSDIMPVSTQINYNNKSNSKQNFNTQFKI